MQRVICHGSYSPASVLEKEGTMNY